MIILKNIKRAKLGVELRLGLRLFFCVVAYKFSGIREVL